MLSIWYLVFVLGAMEIKVESSAVQSTLCDWCIFVYKYNNNNKYDRCLEYLQYLPNVPTQVTSILYIYSRGSQYLGIYYLTLLTCNRYST